MEWIARISRADIDEAYISVEILCLVQTHPTFFCDILQQKPGNCQRVSFTA